MKKGQILRRPGPLAGWLAGVVMIGASVCGSGRHRGTGRPESGTGRSASVQPIRG